MGKPQPPKQPQPIRGMKTKRVLHWGLLALTPVSAAAVLVLAFTDNLQGGAQAGATPTEMKEENPAMGSKARAFAIQFASEYLYVTGDSEGRKKRLAPFLAKGLDAQAGLTTEERKKSMYPQEIRFWESRPIGANQAEIVLQVELYYYEGEKVKNRGLRYLAVPVEVKDANHMAVIGTPHFVPMDVQAKGINRKVESLEKDDSIDSSVQNGIRKFLQDYFKDFASGSSSDLAYKTESDNPIRGFEGKLDFASLDQVELTRERDGYTAIANVTFTDPRSNAQLKYAYKVGLTQEDGQWKVTHLEPTN